MYCKYFLDCKYLCMVDIYLCVRCRMQIYLVLSEINQCPAHRVQTVVLWSAAMSDGSISTPHLNIPNTLVTTLHYQSCSRGGNLCYMLEHTTYRLGFAAIKQTKGWNFLLHPVTTSLHLHSHCTQSTLATSTVPGSEVR